MNSGICELLDKYWDGETTLEEEILIKEYFQSGNVSADHLPFLPLFQHFKDQKDIKYTLPDASVIITKSREEPGIFFLPKYRKLAYASAAVLALFLASWFVFNPGVDAKNTNSYVREIEDPEEAYRVTMEALALVSGKLNKGTESISISLNNVNKANIFK